MISLHTEFFQALISSVSQSADPYEPHSSALSSALRLMGTIYNGIVSTLNEYPVLYIFLFAPFLLGIVALFMHILTSSENDRFGSMSAKSGVSYFGRLFWKDHLDTVREKKRLAERAQREEKRRQERFENERISMARAVFNHDKTLQTVEINGHIYSRDRVEVHKRARSNRKFGKLFTVHSDDSQDDLEE